jgi:hypothetical protein
MPRRQFPKRWILKSLEVSKLKLFVLELKRRGVETKITKRRVYEIMSV